MGHTTHNAIIVTSWEEDLLQKANEKAISIFGSIAAVSPITPATMNGYRSFLIAPDGSKEGWDHSNIGDQKRACFINWLDAQAYDDGGNALDYVEVQFADDYGEIKIIRHNGMASSNVN